MVETEPPSPEEARRLYDIMVKARRERVELIKRRVPPRDFAAVSFWKDGVKYTVGGCNISKEEILKIAESMF